ncbi:MAG: ribonuclease HII [Candidatus Gracilibacteria bacterium]|nr:ribonuclease HII [Candidatus Gracilibacteria bacterium]
MIVAGVDEAGRGALAGPVVAAAVVLPDLFPRDILADSKILSDARRRIACNKIRQHCDWGVGIVSAEEIDEIGIKRATRKAMWEAIQQLRMKPDTLLVDGKDRFHFPIESKDCIRGDATCPEISAASIVAKVVRDDLMIDLGRQFAAFDFVRNKGYASSFHLRLLEQEKYTPEHRKTYEPLRTYLVQRRLFVEL